METKKITCRVEFGRPYLVGSRDCVVYLTTPLFNIVGTGPCSFKFHYNRRKHVVYVFALGKHRCKNNTLYCDFLQLVIAYPTILYLMEYLQSLLERYQGLFLVQKFRLLFARLFLMF